MLLYKTVMNEGEDEQIIEKSRFIVHVKPVETKEEADEFIASVKKQYKDATHNVPAMVIGDKMQIQWGSDDGEPQGTSGAPIVQMLVNEGITNVALVVTRYFGGIKLGTGGLVRAYTSSAKLGILAAGICEVCEMKSVRVKVDYSIYSKLENYRFDFDVFRENIEYTDCVSLDLVIKPEVEEQLKTILTNISDGKVIFVKGESVIKKSPVSA